jgi:hypothetical protein
MAHSRDHVFDLTIARLWHGAATTNGNQISGSGSHSATFGGPGPQHPA